VAIARDLLLSKLPKLGIEIENQQHYIVVAETESEYTVEFSTVDQDGRSHDGRVEISKRVIVFTEMDGNSIF